MFVAMQLCMFVAMLLHSISNHGVIVMAASNSIAMVSESHVSSCCLLCMVMYNYSDTPNYSEITHMSSLHDVQLVLYYFRKDKFLNDIYSPQTV